MTRMASGLRDASSAFERSAGSSTPAKNSSRLLATATGTRMLLPRDWLNAAAFRRSARTTVGALSRPRNCCETVEGDCGTASVLVDIWFSLNFVIQV